MQISYKRENFSPVGSYVIKLSLHSHSFFATAQFRGSDVRENQLFTGAFGAWNQLSLIFFCFSCAMQQFFSLGKFIRHNLIYFVPEIKKHKSEMNPAVPGANVAEFIIHNKHLAQFAFCEPGGRWFNVCLFFSVPFSFEENFFQVCFVMEHSHK